MALTWTDLVNASKDPRNEYTDPPIVNYRMSNMSYDFLVALLQSEFHPVDQFPEDRNQKINQYLLESLDNVAAAVAKMETVNWEDLRVKVRDENMVAWNPTQTLDGVVFTFYYPGEEREILIVPWSLLDRCW